MSLSEEQRGVIYMGGGKENYTKEKSGILMPTNPIEEAAEKLRLEKEIEEAATKYLELQRAKQADLDARLETLELLPMLDKIIILPYPRNPYKKAIQGSILVEYNGDFVNPDSGEKDNLKEFVGCGQVIEVGPLAKYLKIGDDVFYDTRSVYPVPFMSMGYKLTSEVQILCVLNDGLKARFKME